MIRFKALSALVVGLVFVVSQESYGVILNNTSSDNYTILYGPARTFAPISGTKTQTNSFAVMPAPSMGELFIVNGSGADLSAKSCAGLGTLAKIVCVAMNAVNALRMSIERPTSVDILLNGAVVVSQSALPKTTSSLIVPVSLRSSNVLVLKIKGSILSSVQITVRGLDHVAPILTLIQPSEGQLIAALSTSVNGSSNEPLASAKARLGEEQEQLLTVSGDGRSFSGQITTAIGGAKALKVTGRDRSGNETVINRNIIMRINRAPNATLSLASAGSGIAPLVVLFDGSSSSDPDGDVLSYEYDFGDGERQVSANPKVSHEFKSEGNFEVILTVRDSGSLSSAASVRVFGTLPTLPPDPIATAPLLSETAPQKFSDTIDFLYTGPNPVQKDVAPGAIDATRVAVISGQVLDQNSRPLAGVKVSSLNRLDLGHTTTRVDGKYDLAINSGGITTLRFERNGFTASSREVDVDQQTMLTLESILLTRRDSKVTNISVNSPVSQVARASTVEDFSGLRTATVVIPPSTNAQLRMPSGALVSVPNLNIRMTEFTVGENGPAKMPAALPARSGYTYAFEVTSDEAIAMGAERIVFSKPVSFYIDNFLSFPTGIAVPLGYLNSKTGYWEAERDGVVVSVLSHTNGRADLDFGSSDNSGATQFALFGVDDSEREKIATLYQPGQSFWRMRLSHFSVYDANGNNAKNPDLEKQNLSQNDKNNQKTRCKGCEIDIVSGTMSEKIELPGSGTTLHYTTKRAGIRRQNSTVEIPILGEVYSSNITRITVKISIAGVRLQYAFLPRPNLSFTHTWNGRDAFNRLVYTEQEMEVETQIERSIRYSISPYNPALPISFGMTGIQGTIDSPARTNLVTSSVQKIQVRPPVDAATIHAIREVGRWTLEQHHFYDVKTSDMYKGNGEIVNATNLQKVVRQFAGTSEFGFGGDGGPALGAKLGAPRNFTFDNAGNVILADYRNNRLRKIDRVNGIITTIAGNGTTAYSGDGGLAINAGMGSPLDVSVDRDDNIFFSDYTSNRVRKISRDGVITTVVGTGVAGYSGDGGLATEAKISGPRSVIANPDGSLYVSEEFNNVIRRVDPNGIISTYAGTGTEGYSGDGGLATEAQFSGPNYTATDSRGNLYVAQGARCALRKITPTGIVSTIAGTGTCGTTFDGEPADLSQIGSVAAIAVSRDGIVYFADRTNSRIKMIDQNGAIASVVGTGETAFNGTNRSGQATNLLTPTDLEFRADGSFVFVDTGYNTLFEYVQAPLFRDPETGNIRLGNADGSEFYVFNSNGLHLRTEYADTRATKYSFTYDGNNRLLKMIDSFGNETSVERSSNGTPSAIRSPYGQLYSLTVVPGANADENLTNITFPTGEMYKLGYNLDGLLQQFTKPRGGVTSYSYTGTGRIAVERDAAGGFQNIFGSTRVTREGETVRSYNSQDRVGNSFLTLQYSDEFHRSVRLEGGLTSENDRTGTRTTMVSTADTRAMGHTTYPSYFERQSSDGGSESWRKSRTYNGTETAFVRREITTHERGWSESTFDNSTRVYSTTTSQGRTSSVRIDQNTLPIEIRVGGIAPIKMSYDGRGRISAVEQGVRKTEFSYDANGNLFETKNALGQVTRTNYDGSQKLNSSVNANSESVAFQYDLDQNLEQILMPGNVIHSMTTTFVDLMSGHRSPLGQTIGFTYDFDKRLSSVQRGDGKQVRYLYTGGEKKYLEQIVTDSQSIYLRYKAGRPLLALNETSDGSSIGYQYNGARPLQKQYNGPFQSEVGVTYDFNGMVPSGVWAGGSYVAITHNSDREPNRVGDLFISRDGPTGLLTLLSMNSLSEQFNYSEFGEVQSRSASNGSTLIASESYTRDLLGRVTTKASSLGSTVENESYGYDPAGRLVAVNRTGPFAANVQYVYDGRGNRTSVTRNGVTTGATFDADDRLVSSGDLHFRYNDHGEMIEKENVVSGVKLTLAYDQRGQLIRANLPGREVRYTIDGEGRRLTRSVNGVLTHGYMHDFSSRLVAEVSPSGAVLTHFIYASQGHSPDYMIKNGQKYYFVKGHLGSIRAVVNSSTGIVSQVLAYDEFGRVLSDSNPGFQPFGFAGGQYDQETGLGRFGARDYDAETGRWTAKDPILFDGGQSNLYSYVGTVGKVPLKMETNLYGYSWNDPVNFIDPNGESAIGVGAAIVGGLIVFGVIDYFTDVDSRLFWNVLPQRINNFFDPPPPTAPRPPRDTNRRYMCEN